MLDTHSHDDNIYISFSLSLSPHSRYPQACRLLQEMTEIPLEGFLLTPVQKICKYHLQLAELLKYTAPDHPDHPHVQSAVEAMKRIAKLVNERKRKMESIETLAEWQMMVDDWEVSGGCVVKEW